MEIKEAVAFLDDLMLKHDFPLSARTDCFYRNESKINTMQSIFDLKSPEDFTYLFAVSNLLSETPEAVNDYFLKENNDCSFADNLREPDRNDLLLVATAMEENPKFFSIAFYWVGVIESRLELSKKNEIDASELAEKATKTSNSSTTYFVIAINKEIEELKYAASGDNEGWGKNITKIPVENIGELEILGESDTQQIVFDFFIAEEYQAKKFELTVEYEVNGEPFTAVLRNDFSEPQAVISTEPIDVDFSLGLKIKRVSCKPLSEHAEKNNSKGNVVRLPNLEEPQDVNCDFYVSVAAAGTIRTNNITTITIEPLGELEIQGYEGDAGEEPYITFVIFLNEEYQTKKFEIKIEFAVGEEKGVSTIVKNYDDPDYDIPAKAIHVDFAKGVKITNVSWRPL